MFLDRRLQTAGKRDSWSLRTAWKVGRGVREVRSVTRRKADEQSGRDGRRETIRKASHQDYNLVSSCVHFPLSSLLTFSPLLNTQHNC